jgi:lipopolysaccharide heptosyltransferase II
LNLNADFQRWVDKWVGVPLCFLLTLVKRGAGLFNKGGQRNHPPRRILFILLSENGALILAGHAVELARKRFPEATLFFLTSTLGCEILDLMGQIDPENVMGISTKSPVSFFHSSLGAVRFLRHNQIDTTVNLETFARFSTLLAFLSGASRRVGFSRFHDEGRYLGDLTTHKVIYNPHLHAASSYQALVEAIAEPADGEPLVKKAIGALDFKPRPRPIAPNAREQMLSLIKELYPPLRQDTRLVILNPNASDIIPARCWPAEHFAALARGLLEDASLLVVLTGSPEERPKTERLRGIINSKRVVNLAGMTTLTTLVDLFDLGSLLVTNDSGPAHFATLTEIPIIVLFGPETPKLFGPLGLKAEVIYQGLACSPCVSAYNQKKSPCSDNLCLKNIAPAAVLAVAQRLLGKS